MREATKPCRVCGGPRVQIWASGRWNCRECLARAGAVVLDDQVIDAADRQELRYISEQHGNRLGPSTPPYAGYAKDRRRAHRLKRLGLVRVEQYSEHTSGEGRFYWWAFYVTDAGRKLL